MLILGVDPGTHQTGWAIVAHERILVSSGIIKGGSGNAVKRIQTISREMGRILDQYSPDIVVIERPDDQGIVGRTSGAQTLLASVCFFIAGQLECSLFSYVLVPVRQWKGNLPKQVVWNRLVEHYGNVTPRSRGKYPWYNDAADALGIADWWIQRNQKRVKGCTPTQLGDISAKAR